MSQLRYGQGRSHDRLVCQKYPFLAWAEKRRRLRLHFTPTYASWLNQIEIWFNIFSRDVLKGGIWRSKRALVTQIMHYIRCYNEQSAHPFKWTYKGEPLSA
jgi:transposase